MVVDRRLERIMKVRASVKRMCRNCKVIKRRGVVRIICADAKHKQRQGQNEGMRKEPLLFIVKADILSRYFLD